MRKILFLSLVLMVIGIGLLHYFTPGYLIFYHDTYRRLSYFPITIGAIWFGLPGGIILAVLSCVSFIPHLLTFWIQGPEAYYSELSEILFYLSAGVVIGLISSRETRLRAKLEKSYKRLHDQARQLMYAEEQLGQSQKLSMLGHLSASLAHEIKNPLASIKGAAEILADELPEGHPKHEFIEIMVSEISRLNSSVEDVLKYCQGQQESREIKYETLEKIIHRVCSLLESQIKKKSIGLLTTIKEETKHFQADEAKLTQVFLNIILNAIDAVPEKGRINIELFKNSRDVIINISDNGPGIQDKIRTDIFEPFVTEKEGGTGLGLSISKKIIQSFGGCITILESSLGGACFSIVLPDQQSSDMKDI